MRLYLLWLILPTWLFILTICVFAIIGWLDRDR